MQHYIIVFHIKQNAIEFLKAFQLLSNLSNLIKCFKICKPQPDAYKSIKSKTVFANHKTKLNSATFIKSYKMLKLFEM